MCSAVAHIYDLVRCPEVAAKIYVGGANTMGEGQSIFALCPWVNVLSLDSDGARGWKRPLNIFRDPFFSLTVANTPGRS